MKYDHILRTKIAQTINGLLRNKKYTHTSVVKILGFYTVREYTYKTEDNNYSVHCKVKTPIMEVIITKLDDEGLNESEEVFNFPLTELGLGEYDLTYWPLVQQYYNAMNLERYISVLSDYSGVTRSLEISFEITGGKVMVVHDLATNIVSIDGVPLFTTQFTSLPIGIHEGEKH